MTFQSTPLKRSSLPSVNASWIQTPLGSMLAVADNNGLYYLNFVKEEDKRKHFLVLGFRIEALIQEKENDVLNFLKMEVNSYFKGDLKSFATPLHFSGSSFQTLAWRALMEIPYGETRSYKEQAEKMNVPSSYRAAANANGHNRHLLIVPCHRVICSDGSLGGYTSGIFRKQWLLEHEKNHFSNPTIILKSPELRMKNS